MDRVRGPFLLLRPRLLPRNGGETRRPDREAGCCPGTAVRPADPIAKRVVQQVLPVCTTIWLCVWLRLIRVAAILADTQVCLYATD